MNKEEYKFVFGIIVLGEMNVGTTSLAERFTYNKFHSGFPGSLGFVLRNKSLHIDNNSILIDIIDLDQRYYPIQTIIYKKYHGIILTYDISNIDSFKHIQDIFEIVELNATSDVRKILIGNKCDKPEREITEEEGKILADEFNINFFETSAKTGYNVNEAFDFLIRDIFQNFKKTDEYILKLHKDYKKLKNKKCIK